MGCDGDEDQCIQRLYAWADNAGAAEGYEEEGEEEEDEGEEKEVHRMGAPLPTPLSSRVQCPVERVLFTSRRGQK